MLSPPHSFRSHLEVRVSVGNAVFQYCNDLLKKILTSYNEISCLVVIGIHEIRKCKCKYYDVYCCIFCICVIELNLLNCGIVCLIITLMLSIATLGVPKSPRTPTLPGSMVHNVQHRFMKTLKSATCGYCHHKFNILSGGNMRSGLWCI